MSKYVCFICGHGVDTRFSGEGMFSNEYLDICNGCLLKLVDEIYDYSHCCGDGGALEILIHSKTEKEYLKTMSERKKIALKKTSRKNRKASDNG